MSTNYFTITLGSKTFSCGSRGQTGKDFSKFVDGQYLVVYGNMRCHREGFGSLVCAM